MGVEFCSEAWIIIISYLANVQARAAELSLKAEALQKCIFNGLFTPTLITPDFLQEVLAAQERIEKELAVNINIEEGLAKTVQAATAAYQKAHPYKE